MQDGYEIQVGSMEKGEWEGIIQSFDDANLYQTWSWGAVRWHERNLSHVVLKKGGVIVAAAQVWILRVPVLRKGIAYVKRGPMWRSRICENDMKHYSMMVRALRDEYVGRRGLMLRIMPNVTTDRHEDIHDIMLDDGFIVSSTHTGYRTYIVDLAEDLEGLRMGLKRKWRQNLSGAAKSGLTVEEGCSEELLETAAGVYKEMHARKKFAEHISLDLVRRIHASLGQDIKMRVIVCRYMDKPVTAYISSLVGGTGLDVLSGTVSEGLRLNSAYLAHWKMLEWFKELGCRWYDLGGIEPVNFPGPYKFKSGLAGAKGVDLTFNQYDFCPGLSTGLTVKAAESLDYAYRMMRDMAVRLV